MILSKSRVKQKQALAPVRVYCAAPCEMLYCIVQHQQVRNWAAHLLLIVQGQLSRDKSSCFEDFLDERDYVGAAAFLNFQQKDGSSDDQALEWLAYVHYHNWEHSQVLLVHVEAPFATEIFDIILHCKDVMKVLTHG